MTLGTYCSQNLRSDNQSIVDGTENLCWPTEHAIWYTAYGTLGMYVRSRVLICRLEGLGGTCECKETELSDFSSGERYELFLVLTRILVLDRQNTASLADKLVGT